MAVLVFNTDLALTLILVFLVCMLVYRAKPREVGRIVRENFSFAYVSIVAGILAFRGAGGHGGRRRDCREPHLAGHPPFFVLIILPFVIAMSTGMTMAYVGITFPILLTYFTTGDFPMIAFMLAYAGGYAGIMLSPVHLCLVLTARYYRASFPASIDCCGCRSCSCSRWPRRPILSPTCSSDPLPHPGIILSHPLRQHI